MIGKTEVQLDVQLYEPELITDEMLERCVKPAMQAAIEVIEEAAEAKLVPHQSQQTGTRQLQSAKAKERSESRINLIDGLRTRVFVDKPEKTVSGVLFLDDEVEYIGKFLEFSRKHVFWGRDREEYREGSPFLRPAYDENKEYAMAVFGERLRDCMNRKKRREFRRKVVTILIVGGVGAAIGAQARAPGQRTPFDPLPELDDATPLFDLPGADVPTPSDAYWIAA